MKFTHDLFLDLTDELYRVVAQMVMLFETSPLCGSTKQQQIVPAHGMSHLPNTENQMLRY